VSTATAVRVPSTGDYSRVQKAAAILLSVGPEAAAKVLEFLTEAEVERVAYEVATLGEIRPERLEGILEEFHTEAVANQYLIAGGEHHAREMLRRWRGGDADDIIDRLLATVRTTPFHFLRLYEPSEICQQLREEHPQTVALVLAHLPTKFAAAVLAGLEPDAQAEVAVRVATMEGTSPEVINRVEAALQTRMGEVGERRRRTEQGGVRELASMLNNSDRGTERAILGNLEATNPELAEQIRALMFVFEDIVTLDKRAIQELLRQIDPKRLALAMKGCVDDVKAVINDNLSERARETLNEEIALLGPAQRKDVEAAQSEIVQLIRRLEEAGKIVVNRGGGDDGELIE
jgi:flagellar motor switch protein FliG